MRRVLVYLLLPVVVVLIFIASVGELAQAAYWKLHRWVNRTSDSGHS